MQPLMLMLIVLLGAAVLVPLARARTARRKPLASLALRNSWTYTPADPWDLPAEMEGFWLGTWGHDHCCRDVMGVPTDTGALWLGQFERQMSSGRQRRTERFALALVRVNAPSGGIAILPRQEWFAPAGLFERYRRIEDPGVPAGRQIWAERPGSQRQVVSRLAELCMSLPIPAAIEARGSTAVAYWSLTHPIDEPSLLALASLGRQLIEALSSAPRER